jgi:hypothetical protein
MTLDPVPQRNRPRRPSVLPCMSLNTPLHGRRAAVLAVLAVLVALAGCTAGEAPSHEPPASDRPTRTDNPAQPVPSESAAPVVGEVPEALLEEILADAAERAGIDVEALEVARAEAVVWNDGSLGCPEPDMLYTQALVDGYHVVVVADDVELDYRATANGTFRLCENPGPPSGG